MKFTALVLATTMTAASLPVRADVISTDMATAPAVAGAAAAARARLESLLARADVQAGLARYGVSTEQAAARVAAMSDQEVASLDGRLDKVTAGGDILGVAVFLFVLLLVTDILGLTKVFPFTRSIRR
jgi:hypothetical protein